MKLRKVRKRWVLDIKLKKHRIRKVIYNQRLGEKMIEILQKFKDIEQGRKFLQEMSECKMINEEQSIAFKTFLNKEYSEVLEGQKEQIKILVEELKDD